MTTSLVPSAVSGVRELDALLRAFADPTRIRLLNLLTVGELCVCDLVATLGIAQPVVSRHLAYLRRAGLLQVRRDGRFAYYRLAPPANDVHGALVECLRDCFGAIPALAGERAEAKARHAERRAQPCADV